MHKTKQISQPFRIQFNSKSIPLVQSVSIGYHICWDWNVNMEESPSSMNSFIYLTNWVIAFSLTIDVFAVLTVM